MGITIPTLQWLKSYKKSFLKSDLSAGIIVAFMLIPQGMAYAMLAGLPPVYGIYASTLPVFIYALFGSSRHLAVGPVAILSLLVAVTCSNFAEPESAEYIRIAALLTLMVGMFQLVLGFLRAGFLVNFVSHAVINGFVSAAVIIIALSQVENLLGLTLQSGHSTIPLLMEVISKLNDTNLPTAVMGISSAGLLFFGKKQWPGFPLGLIILVVGTFLVYFFDLHGIGISIVGEVPRGLPHFSSISFDMKLMVKLFPAATIILFIGYMESMAVAQWAATREKYRIYPNREFKALGTANVLAALFSGYVVAGGFSRTAVNYEVGAKSPLASLITAGLILGALLFFTPLFYYIPHAILAAIIIVSLTGLIDYKYAFHLFRLKITDGWILVATFLVTLLIGIEQGLLTGILFSLTLYVAQSSRPHIAVLGYVEEEKTYRDIHHYPKAVTHPHLIIIRIDASMYFANARFVEDHVREQLVQNPRAHWIILDMSGVNDIDGVAVYSLGNMKADCAHHAVGIAFAGMKASVRKVLTKADWYHSQDQVMMFSTIEQAVQHLLKEADEKK